MFPEDGAAFPVRVFLYKDMVTVGIDTTGESLHKRGYRKMAVKAPIAENLAAGLLMLTPWNADRILVDPFCGSGTIPIEAAMMAAHIAPGLNREFTAEKWTGIVSPRLWSDLRDEAKEEIDINIDTDIQGYDIDPDAVAAARDNAHMAGVEKLIHLQARPVSQLSHPKKYGFIITNPPYGERITTFTPGSNAPQSIAQARQLRGAAADTVPDSAAGSAAPEEIAALYRTLGERYRLLDDWSLYVITSYENCERDLGMKAAKNRKIYNGMLRTYFYMFPGAKPKGRH
jgi:putative N6-adenine-specific DNA methylase